METFGALLGAVALAAPMQAPPPPKMVLVPQGFFFANGKVMPLSAQVVQFAPPVLLNPVVVIPDECRT